MSPEDWKTLLDALAEPFPESVIEWRAGSTTRDKKKAQALPYAESRTYEDRLNQLVGGDWECHFKPWGDSRIICELTIHGQTRSSTGEENEGFAPGTSCEAQAFKRACSKFGLGRYLYEIDAPWVPYDSEKRKLLETPKVPQKFLPSKGKEDVPDFKPNRKAQLETMEDAIDSERAFKLLTTLNEMGFETADVLTVASRLAGFEVKRLTQINEDYAGRLYGHFKRAYEERENPKAVWQTWEKPDDAITWAMGIHGEDGKPIFKAGKHASNSYQKLKDEYLDALPKSKKPTDDIEDRVRHFHILNHHWYFKLAAKCRGKEYSVPKGGIVPINDGAPWDDLKAA